MDFRNSTHLNSARLYALFLRHTQPYRHDALTVQVRYSRGADFSGACYYRSARLTINLGRANRYPYSLGTNIAKARSNATHWWRPIYRLAIADAYQLALFIYLHELFHYLVKAAGRARGRKEGMCDRFAARVLIDQYQCAVQDGDGLTPPRETWDFQDLTAFVANAPRQAACESAERLIPVTILGSGSLW